VASAILSCLAFLLKNEILFVIGLLGKCRFNRLSMAVVLSLICICSAMQMNPMEIATIWRCNHALDPIDQVNSSAD